MVREKFTTPKVDPNRTVAFTGYRPQKILESLARLKRKYPLSTIHHVVNERLKTLIHTLYREGYDTYMTGMADGFDVWAAMAVLERNYSPSEDYNTKIRSTRRGVLF